MEVNFQKSHGKALAAHLDKVALDKVQRAILEKGKPPPSPAKQLALLRAEQGTKRPGVVLKTTCISGACAWRASRAPSDRGDPNLGEGWYKEIRRRLSGKAAENLYRIYTHEDGRTCSSKAQLIKMGGVDNSVDRRTLKKGVLKPKARGPKAKAEGKVKTKPTAKASDDELSIDSDENVQARI